MDFLRVMAFIFAALGGLGMVFVFTSSNSAPQEAAGSAMALGIAVIPYIVYSIAAKAEANNLLRQLLERGDDIGDQ